MEITKDYLEKLHIEEKLNFKEIGKKLGKAESTIHRWMRNFGIKNQTPPNRTRTYQYNIDYFEKIDTSEKAYFVGWLLADGTITTIYQKNGALKQRKLRIVLKRDDRELLEKFNTALEGNLPITDFIQETFDGEYPASRIDVNCTKLCNDLIKIGIKPDKSNKETLPNIPSEFMFHFLRGYFDGDGSLSIKHKDKWFWAHYTQVGSEEILHDIKSIFENENVIFPKVNIISLKGINQLMCNKTENVLKIIELLYKEANVYLERKKVKCEDFYVAKTGKSLFPVTL